jgi:hypothetical protein
MFDPTYLFKRSDWPKEMTLTSPSKPVFEEADDRHFGPYFQLYLSNFPRFTASHTMISPLTV